MRAFAAVAFAVVNSELPKPTLNLQLQLMFLPPGHTFEQGEDEEEEEEDDDDYIDEAIIDLIVAV